jgi:uncharacterized protein
MRKDQLKQPVSGLEFNVAQLLKEVTGATRSYHVEAIIAEEFDENLKVVSPLVGQVRFLRTGPNILATGQLRANLEKSCGRCLATFTAPVVIEVEEEFFPTLDIVTGTVIAPPADVEEANLIDEHHILDLSEVVRQDLLLASEEIRYCRPDCKGLCPHCGQDLNLGSCNCEDNLIDPRWAALQALQED